MKIQFVLKKVALAQFIVGCCCAQWNHDPGSPIGQLAWGQVASTFATCGTKDSSVGQHQSPVDIQTAATLQGARVPIRLNYAPLTPENGGIEIENTGHVVEGPYPPGSFLRLSKSTQFEGDQDAINTLDSYQLLQFHFHAPSEHTLDGKR